MQDRKLLKRYLAQYYHAKERKSTLEARSRTLRRELQPAKKTPDLEAKISEIDARVQRQKEIETSTILEVMDMIDFLPIGSTERHILELRHIDCKSWSDIERIAHFSRSSCFEYYDKALDTLLTYKRARQMLARFQARIARLEKDG